MLMRHRVVLITTVYDTYQYEASCIETKQPGDLQQLH